MAGVVVASEGDSESVVFEVSVLCFLLVVMLYWIWSFVPYLRALGSADNIWERTKKRKTVTLTLPDGQERSFDFHQQYREGGPGKNRLKGKRVLIVGAGLGLEAMAAALAGASLVVCSDGDALLLELTRENIKANMEDAEADPITVMQLLWGEQAHMNEAKKLSLSDEGYDVILGSDVVYESSINKGSMLQAYEGLFETFLHLSNPNTSILLAYKPRFPTEPFFFNIMHEYFAHTEIEDEASKDSPVSIFEYTKKAN